MIPNTGSSPTIVVPLSPVWGHPEIPPIPEASRCSGSSWNLLCVFPERTVSAYTLHAVSAELCLFVLLPASLDVSRGPVAFHSHEGECLPLSASYSSEP